MIKLSKAISSRTLFLLISFALFCFLPGCGGSGNTAGQVYTLTVTTDPSVTSLKAGETLTIKATVKDSTGAAASGQAVTFTLYQDNSGATLTISGTGSTDANGLAQASYTAGANTPTVDVTDIVQASIPDSSQQVTITRLGAFNTLAITTDPSGLTMKAGEIVTITATVKDRNGVPVSGQAVDFTVFRNNSGGTIAISGTGTTDGNGEAKALYTVGPTSPAEAVQDLIRVSIPDVPSQTITISREAGTAAQANVASIDIAASPASIKTDNSTTSTITVNALSAGNAILSGVTVNLSTDTGVLSAPTITTPATVILSCGGTNKANRTATITATVGTLTPVQIPVQIIGSTITVLSDSTSISPSGVANLTVTAKDAGGNPVSGAAITLTQSGTGSVTLGATTGTTDISGQFTTTATGGANGNVTITAAGLGATGTANISVTSPADTFAISNLILDGTEIANTSITALKINTSALRIIVHAPAGPVPPAVNNVTFATTIGVWDGGASKAITKAVHNDATYGRIADATLTSTTIGVANVQVYDAANINTSDTLTVAMSSGAVPGKISIQAAPTVVSVSVGTTAGSSTLTATVTDALNNPLGGQPVLFSIVSGTSTSGGETISPVVQMTAATATSDLTVGQARATFTSGSMPSAGTGVQIRASVLGTAIETEPIGVNLTPSGNDAKIVIGGVAGSIAFGQATVIGVDDTQANYTWKMSVLVSDSNGNAVPEAIVSLGVWPIGWSTGLACGVDPDTPITGTFWNEDANENLILDAGEDGTRCYYADPTKATCVLGGTLDGLITPTNSHGGSLPASVKTDDNGVAGFTLTYPKQSALWTIDRIRATTIVQGSETRSEIILQLPALEGDVIPCHLGDSPYKF